MAANREAVDSRVVRRAVAVVATLFLVIAPVSFAGAAHKPRQGSSGLGSPSADTAVPTIPSGSSLATVRSWLDQALRVRLSALSSESSAVTRSTTLTTAHRAALEGVISSDRTGLSRIAGGVASDTLASLRTEVAAMVLDYRVLALLAPLVNAVIATDLVGASAAALAASEPAIETAITTEVGTGRASQIETTYRSLVGDVASAQGSLASNAASLLALNPVSYASSSSTINAATVATQLARTELSAAESDVRQIARLLSTGGQQSTTTTSLLPILPRTLSTKLRRARFSFGSPRHHLSRV